MAQIRPKIGAQDAELVIVQIETVNIVHRAKIRITPNGITAKKLKASVVLEKINSEFLKLLLPIAVRDSHTKLTIDRLHQ